jgi:peptidylprolyl isomerase
MIKYFANYFYMAQLFSNLAVRLRFISFVLLIGLASTQCSSPEETDRKEEADVIMVTDYGDVYMKLFDDVPKHKANFIKLAREGFFDGMTFHRVIKGFMVQTGDPRTIEGATTRDDDAGYTLPAEINPRHLHVEGSIAAARMGDEVNPKWESSSSQFYIVTGKPVNDELLDNAEDGIAYATERRMAVEHQELVAKGEYKDNFMNFLADRNYASFTYSDEQRKAYAGKFGTPFLDMQYTVFGEVVSGMDIVQKIQHTQTGPGDVPVEPIRIRSLTVVEH